MGIIIQIDGKNFDMDKWENPEQVKGYVLVIGEGIKYKGVNAPYDKTELAAINWYWLNRYRIEYGDGLVDAMAEAGEFNNYSDSFRWVTELVDQHEIYPGIKTRGDYGRWFFNRAYGGLKDEPIAEYIDFEAYGADVYQSDSADNHHLTSYGLLIKDE